MGYDENEVLQRFKVVYSVPTNGMVEKSDTFKVNVTRGEADRGEKLFITMSADWLIIENLGTVDHDVLFTLPIDRVIYTISDNVEYNLV